MSERASQLVVRCGNQVEGVVQKGPVCLSLACSLGALYGFTGLKLRRSMRNDALFVRIAASMVSSSLSRPINRPMIATDRQTLMLASRSIHAMHDPRRQRHTFQPKNLSHIPYHPSAVQIKQMSTAPLPI